MMKKWFVYLMVGLFFLSAGTASAIVSDDFSTPPLNTGLWTFVNPLADATLTMTGTNVEITVPSGVSHDVWTSGNFAPRIMQPAANADFEIEVKFQSELSGQYQMQGIIVEQDSQNFLRYDFYSDGTNNRAFAAAFTGGTPTVKNDTIIDAAPGPVPLYMRFKREGNQWTQSYSYDGSNWLTAVTFDFTMTVTSVGAFFGNAGSNPAFTGSLDYFFNTVFPVSPQDGGDAVPPVIDVWYGLNQKFGQIGMPQKQVGILGTVSDPAGISLLTYSINGGPENALSVGPNGTRLQSKGDFNAEILFADLDCGPNTVVINAADNLGNADSMLVNVQHYCNYFWPETYFIDWSTVTDIQDVAQVVDGLWTLDANSIRPIITGYDRMIAFGDIDSSWDDYEVTVPITFSNMIPNLPFVGILMRWQGHYDWDGTQPNWGWWPLGGLGGYGYDWRDHTYKLHIIGNNSVMIAGDNSGRLLTDGVPYIFKMRVETAGTKSIYSLKVWEQGSAEPAGWDISGQGPTGELKYGSAMLLSHYTDTSFGNVTVTPVPFDSTAPTYTWNAPAAGVYYRNGNAINVDALITETGSGLTNGTNCNPKIDNATGSFTGAVLYSSSGGKCTGTLILNDPSGLSDGSHDLTLQVTDNVGNSAVSASRAVNIDNTPPVSGAAFNATPGDGQCSLNWTAATDSGGLHTTQPYELRVRTGADPVSCSGGTQAYIGTGLSTTQTNLTNGTTYYYRLCYKDNVGNQSEFSGNPITCVLPPPQYTLTVNKNGSTGTGTVTSLPAGINCGPNCTEPYDSGTAVTLTAVPDAGSTFAGWSGGGCSGTGTCQVTMNANTPVTAVFNMIPPLAAFTASSVTGVAPFNVSFTDSSSNNPASWSWTFGDGGTSTAQNPVHQYLDPGVFTVSLTVTNAGGSNAITKTSYITVSILPVGLPVRISGTTPSYYSSFTAAYGAVADGYAIQGQAAVFTEAIDCNRNIAVILRGGYDSLFTTNAAFTTIVGSLTITDGTVTVENIILR